MEPVRPDYEGACLNNAVRALKSRAGWVPEPVREARSVVLFVIDGLGWSIVESNRDLMPTISSMEGTAISTVVPSTTTTALTSLTTGLTPAEHGIVGYRLLVGDGVLNVLRWSTQTGRPLPAPEDLQPRLAFNGEPLPVVTRAEFAATGFTAVHLRGARFCGWHAVSSIAVLSARLVAEGESFVYAYYGNADLVFHMHGLDDEFLSAELAFVDTAVAGMLDALPSSCALVVAADHGHVAFEDWVDIDDLDPLIATQSGEARFRYLHARPGAAAELLEAAKDLHSSRAWVLGRDELIQEGLIGPAPTGSVRQRLGDVVLAARAPIGFIDPANQGETRLRSGHGSLTSEEMLVPFLAARGRA